MKVKNSLKKGTVLPIRKTGEDIVLFVGKDKGFKIDDNLDKKERTIINHTEKALAVVKNSEEIQVCCYAQLHTHTQYSILDGMSTVKGIAAKSSGVTAITDHGNMYGFLTFFKTMKKEGKKPVIGEEFYVETVDGKKEGNHLIVLAKDNVGLKNLFNLSSASYKNFYRKPYITLDDLKANKEGLIVTSACMGGELSRALLKDGLEAGCKVAEVYKDVFGDDYYIEIQRHFIKEEETVNPLLVEVSKKLGIKMVAANDSHYLEEGDAKYHAYLLCVNQGKKMAEDHFHFDGTGYHYMTDTEITNLFWDMPEAIASTIEIAEKCNVDIEMGNYHMPKFDIPEGYSDEDEYLEALAKEGFKKRFIGTEHLTDPEYIKRLDYELSVVKNMGYSGYFLIVQDYVNWAKSRGILVGPGRGSAVGSMLSYSIGITDLDPIRYNLLFERFLNPDRVSMPDIDMDFEDSRRGEVIEYVKEKYGAECVCNIVTFGRMKAKNAIRDVARVEDNVALGDRIAKTVPNEPNITLTKAYEQSPEMKKIVEGDMEAKKLVEIALHLEDNPRNTSTHACGIVISDKPLNNYLPTAMVKDTGSDDKNKKTLATQVTMTEVEELGSLKMDFLGLKNMAVIGDALRDVNKARTKAGMKEFTYYREIPINDPYVYAEISEGTSYAVFQIESEGMRKFMTELFSDVKRRIAEIETRYGFTGFGDRITGNGGNAAEYKKAMNSFGDELFERMIAGISLYRPGPMDYIPDYIKGMNDPGSIIYDVPQLEDILKNTYGVICYQEQVMQIVRALGGFTNGQSDTIRKAMGKKKQDILDEFEPYFIGGSGNAIDDHTGKPYGIKGCTNNGIPEEKAKAIWDKMKDFAKYAFNKSHAAGYAVITVTTAWLKHYYPVEFICACLNTYIDSGDKFKAYLNVAKKITNILPPDVNLSDKMFKVCDEGIIFGLKGIKGLSKSVDGIVEERKNGAYKSVEDFLIRTAAKKTTIESLTYVGAFDSFGISRHAIVTALPEVMASAKKSLKENKNQLTFFDDLVMTYKIPPLSEYPEAEKLRLEKEYGGLYISSHPLDQYKDIVKSLKATELGLVKDDEGNAYQGKCTVVGIITDMIIRYTKKDNRPMANLTIEDTSGEIKAVVFPDDYDAAKHILFKEKVVVIKGYIKNDSDWGLQLIPTSISSVEDYIARTGITKVYVKLETRFALDGYKNVLSEYEGDSEAFAQADGKLYKMPISVNPCSSLIMELQNKYGVDNVMMR